MNLRQQKYKQNRILGMSQFNAALAAGYSRNTAINAGKNIEKRCDFTDILEQVAITNQKIAEITRGCLEATRPVVSMGVIVETVPDFGVRHEVVKTLLKVKGILSDKIAEKIVGTENNTHYHLTIDKMAQKLADHKAKQEQDAKNIDRSGTDRVDGLLPEESGGVLKNRLGGITLGSPSGDHESGPGSQEGNGPVS